VRASHEAAQSAPSQRGAVAIVYLQELAADERRRLVDGNTTPYIEALELAIAALGDEIHRKAVEKLLEQALTTDGAHHKQWYFEQIAKMLELEIKADYEPGIAP
jgi:hypothetical protein